MRSTRAGAARRAAARTRASRPYVDDGNDDDVVAIDEPAGPAPSRRSRVRPRRQNTRESESSAATDEEVVILDDDMQDLDLPIATRRGRRRNAGYVIGSQDNSSDSGSHLKIASFSPPILDLDEANGNLLVDDNTRTTSPQRGTPQSDERVSSSDLVTINVSGLRFQTFEKTLARFPNTLLGCKSKRERFYVQDLNEYFFDRHRSTFESILYIYQSGGRVKRPESVPIDIFLREMRFFQMGERLIEEFWIAEGYEKPKETILPTNKSQRRLWELMEYPDSSLAARIIAFISIFVIIISIVSFCWETVPSGDVARDVDTAANATFLATGEKDEGRTIWNPFFWLELMCIVWFTIELTLRFISCPSKVTFLTSFLNIIDFVAIAPFFVNLIWADANKSSSSMSFAVLRVLRLVRVFRIFKLSRHSAGLQILGKTFRASVQEFCLLIFFMAIALVLFSSGMYFAEQGEPNSKFTSIPASFWFVLVTMTTVGYGDLVPLSPHGKIVGSMCALIGVLTLALPVPIIVANFKHFYRQENRLATMRTAGKDVDSNDSGDDDS